MRSEVIGPPQVMRTEWPGSPRHTGHAGKFPVWPWIPLALKADLWMWINPRLRRGTFVAVGRCRPCLSKAQIGTAWPRLSSPAGRCPVYARGMLPWPFAGIRQKKPADRASQWLNSQTRTEPALPMREGVKSLTKCLRTPRGASRFGTDAPSGRYRHSVIGMGVERARRLGDEWNGR